MRTLSFPPPETEALRLKSRDGPSANLEGCWRPADAVEITIQFAAFEGSGQSRIEPLIECMSYCIITAYSLFEAANIEKSNSRTRCTRWVSH